jgi:Ca2+-binding RTX toxin-like protein
VVTISKTLTGSDSNDWIIGTTGAGVISGGLGNDMMAGRSGDNHLEGGSGDDNLAGEDGSDVLEGGAGNDVLSVEGITRDDLWLSRQGNSLLIDVWGSEDCVTAQDWYAGSALRLDAVQVGGSTLYAY